MKKITILLLSIILSSEVYAEKTTPVLNDGILYFNAKVANNQQVELTWTTGIFIDEQGFEVERIDASGVWHKLGLVREGNMINDKMNFLFTDIAPVNGNNTYRLKHLLKEGAALYSDNITIALLRGTKGLSFQNYPNPFTENTLIKYEIATRGPVRIFVFDLSGVQLVQLVSKQDEMPGIYTVQWNGAKYPPGTYIYKIMTADGTVTQKMTKAK